MKVVREISRGGFGRVDEVELESGERVACKSFAPSVPITSSAEREKLLKRFRREVKVQSSLNLRGCVPILSHHLDCDEPYYLMPLAERNFCEEIQDAKKTGVVPQQALADILSGLDELHELNYVHRDLKPANVLLVDGVWRLSDFGLVLPPGGETTKLTSLDSNWGTAGYCAPEQSIEFRNATPHADIYAFGCILHDIYGQALRVPYQKYSAPGEIGGIIERCTEQRPDKRFQSVRALRGVLLTLLTASPAIALSKDASAWLDAVSKVADWDKQVFENFLRFIHHASETSDIYALLRELDEEACTQLEALDADLFKTLAGIYCEWIEGVGFDFDFCDVLIRRLERIFELGDLETKAAVALAAAELGKSHNRWFVMGRVIKMCSPALDETLARRLEIDIQAREAENNFYRCVDVINHEISDYHPRIAALLEKLVADHEVKATA